MHACRSTLEDPTNELARPWLEEIAAHPEKIAGREAQLTALANIADPIVTAPYMQRLFAGRGIDAAGSGPWIELIGKSGGQPELSTLFQALIEEGKLQPAARIRAAGALGEAAKVRRLRPQGDLGAIAPLLQSGDRALLFAGIRLAGQWQQGKLVPALAEFAGNPKDAGLRAEAFAALRIIGGAATAEALGKLVAADRPIEVRREALVPLAVHGRDAALKALPSIMEQTPESGAAQALWRELFQNAPFAAQFAGALPKDLPPAAYADALKVARGLGGGGAALVAALTPATAMKPAERNYAAEIATMVKSVGEGGNASDGELVYRRAGCTACHAIGGVGGKFGPDFSSIGASAPLDYIIESTLNPAAKVKEGYHGFAFTLKDGSVLTGIPARETATEAIIRPAPGAEMALIKANILKKENVGSLMPAGLSDALSAGDKRNLFAFLGQIGRPGPFDASKANVARVWSFGAALPEGAAIPETALSVATLVNGELPKAEIPGAPYASVRLNVSTASTAPLIFTGVKAAWLDGKALALANGRSETPIPAGAHLLTVSPDPAAPHLKAQCDGVTFLDVK